MHKAQGLEFGGIPLLCSVQLSLMDLDEYLKACEIFGGFYQAFNNGELIHGRIVLVLRLSACGFVFWRDRERR